MTDLDPQQPCEDCDGSGKLDATCETCGGDGWVDDPSDGGTMSCPKCDGDPCPTCDGSGRFDEGPPFNIQLMTET